MIIRKATPNDADVIATCLLLAMKDIVYKLIGEEDPVKAREFLLYFAQKESNQYSYQNCWVAEKDTTIVAAVNLYDGAKLVELRQPVIEHIKLHFHKDLLPENETETGEFYIDSLGVIPSYQGKGIGSQILQFLIDEYVNQQNQTLGLLVDKENPNAKRLYVKLGFKNAGEKTLLGKKMEHLQIKS